MIMIRFVKEEDQAFWHTLDPKLPLDQFLRKTRDRQGYVLFSDGVPCAILRYQLFWDEIHFLNLIKVSKEYRGQRLGLALLSQWEQDMLALGFDMVMTSTQSNEDAQTFYRRAGYRDAGCLVMDVPGHEQPTELLFTKKLLPGCACARKKDEAEG